MMTLKPAFSALLIAAYVATAGCSAVSPRAPSESVQQKHLLAGEYYKRGDDEKAIRTWQDVVSANPQHVEAWQNIAVVQEQQLHDSAAAEKTLREALEKNPQNASLHSHLGGVLINLGQLDEALSQREKAHQLAPTDLDILNSYASSCFLAKKYACALSGYEEVAKLDPNFRGIEFNRGLALLAVGNARDAVVAFQAETVRSPLNSEAFGKLGDAYDALGDAQKAIASYQAAIAIEPDLPWPHYNLGVLLHEPNPKQAEQHYREYLKLTPNDGHAWTNLGLLLLNSKRMHEALRAQLTAVQASPDTAHFQFNLGLTWYRNGCLSKALSSINQALKLNPAFPQAIKLKSQVMSKAAVQYEADLEQLKAREAGAPSCKA
jgi:tetratricopeptide (TPR) repeat protein